MGVLDAIDRDLDNTIPDAVLNQARCLIVLPRGFSRGAMTCRDATGHWAAAQLLVADRASNSDELLVVMSERLLQNLRGGARFPDLKVAPGPLARETPLPSDVQLHADLLAYTYNGTVVSGLRGRSANLRALPGDPPRLLSQAFTHSATSLASTILPTGIIIHHSGVVPSETIDELAVDTFHQQRGFDVTCLGREYHVAYHYLILPDGTVQPGRPERCQGAHARGYNSYLGIALAGDFSSQDNPRGLHGLQRPTGKQMEALLELCRQLRQHYHIPLQHILRHSDIASTHCPGDRFPFGAFLRGLERP